MQVQVLGPIEIISSTGIPIPLAGAKARGLVAILALEAGSPVPTHRLIDALWGDQEVAGRNTMQVVVSKLRKALVDAGETDPIATRTSGYELLIARDDVDALRFESDLARIGVGIQGAAGAADALESALNLWRGSPLADAPETEIMAALQARLGELRQTTVEDLVDAQLQLGHHRRLAAELESLVAEEPLRERRWGQLMRALYASGQQADALRAFQRARETLIEEMGVEPSAELRRLEAAVLAQDDSLRAPVPEPQPGAPVGEGLRRRGNVRHPVGSCIGRKDDLRRLVALVEGHRLVTLTGPGGVGKTRLALEVALAIGDEVPEGVWWVELASATDAGDALLAIQRSLQLDPSGATDPKVALASIAAALDDRAAVLVLDNCEHLLGSVDRIVSDLLGQCGSLRIVATSREGLGVPGELLFAVAPLPIEDAVTLFEGCIAGLAADAVTDRDALVGICRRLDGLPLALELAAGRARHMRLAEILERLTDRFDLLGAGSHREGGGRDLRAVADWSYDLLEEPERIVFERLSVFAAGATLSAAQRVCAGAEVAAHDVERLLDRLIDKSLIHADRSGAETRFRMLQTLFDYASDRLAARGDDEAARRAHAEWVRELAGAVGFGVRTTGATIAAVQDEDIAVRDAIEWALDADPTLALEICALLAPFWFGTMRASVGWELLARALRASADEPAAAHTAALGWASVFSTMEQDLETADRLADEAMAEALDRADHEALGRTYAARALSASYRGDRGAEPWAAQAREQFAQAGSAVGLGHVSFAEGASQLLDGDLDAARASLGDALEVFRSEQDHLGMILAVSRLGEAAWRSGDIDLFAATHAELLELGVAGRSVGVTTGAMARLAHARLEQGDLDDAQRLAQGALASSGESFMSVISGYALKTAGLVNLAMGHAPEGRDQLHAAIDAFEAGTGHLGVGLAAMCWLDLSRSYPDPSDADEDRRAAQTAVERADVSNDPWVQAQARAQLAACTRSSRGRSA